jgi:hypothetical protein
MNPVIRSALGAQKVLSGDNKMQTEIVVKKGLCTLHRIEGLKFDTNDSRVNFEAVIQTERILEQLTGFRFHINVKET